MKKISVLIFLFCAVFSTANAEINQRQLDNLEAGKTTYQEVIKEFGRPRSEKNTSAGKTIVYISILTNKTNAIFIPVVGMFKAANLKNEKSEITIKFDRKDKFTKYKTVKIDNR